MDTVLDRIDRALAPYTQLPPKEARRLGATYCDRCARGGPAIRQDPYVAPWVGIEGDDRKALVPMFWVNYFLGDGGRSETLRGNSGVSADTAARRQSPSPGDRRSVMRRPMRAAASVPNRWAKEALTKVSEVSGRYRQIRPACSSTMARVRLSG